MSKTPLCLVPAGWTNSYSEYTVGNATVYWYAVLESNPTALGTEEHVFVSHSVQNRVLLFFFHYR